MSVGSQRLAMIVCMMTHELEVSILAAPLAQMDRRALSQAWYTALRLAPNAAIAPQQAARGDAARVLGASRRFVENRKSTGPANVAAAPARFCVPSRGSIGCVEVHGVGRSRRLPLAERIARVFAGSPTCVKRATFSLGRGNARVHVILQTIGERPTLLALCRPELRTIVGRALAQARLALARRGIGVELYTVAEEGSLACS
jgi:hypothetical protein